MKGSTAEAALSREARSGQIADTVMMLILMLAKQAGAGGRSESVSGKTLGLVGFGEVGFEVAKRAGAGFGMKVLVHGPEPADGEAAELHDMQWISSLDELLTSADVVSLHCQDSPENHHLINARRLNQMKSDALLINTAHGGIVDEQALVHALWFETIGGVGISVEAGQLHRLSDLRACDRAALLMPHPEDAGPESGILGRIESGNNVIDLFEGRKRRDQIRI